MRIPMRHGEPTAAIVSRLGRGRGVQPAGESYCGRYEVHRRPQRSPLLSSATTRGLRISRQTILCLSGCSEYRTFAQGRFSNFIRASWLSGSTDLLPAHRPSSGAVASGGTWPPVNAEARPAESPAKRPIRHCGHRSVGLLHILGKQAGATRPTQASREPIMSSWQRIVRHSRGSLCGNSRLCG